MASFTALNIIPDEHSDDEIDNTRELQIEEALKAYQNALRLHAQGPATYPQAGEAYSTLFQSDIFKYPEGTTEFERLDENPELEVLDPSFPLELDLVAAGADSTLSTLPQLLYLAYKNHGQFILDCVKDRQRRAELKQATTMNGQALHFQAKAAIDNFALALARDESDTELWRRAARIATMLGSRRISRYCLEAAVEVDDDPTVAEVEPPSLEEGFAGEQLKKLLRILSDEVSLSHPIIAPFLKKEMAPFVSKHMDPYKFLPDSAATLAKERLISSDIETTELPYVVFVPEYSWASVGGQLCASTFGHGTSATKVKLEFVEGDPRAVEPPASAEHPEEDHVMKDVEIVESPVVETALPTPTGTTGVDQPTETTTTTTTVPLNDEVEKPQGISLPTRKRSQSAAGLRDTPDDDSATQKRSKRIRNRDNTTELDPAAQFAADLDKFEQADIDVFNFVGGLLRKLNVIDLGTFAEWQSASSGENNPDRSDHSENVALRDLRDILRSWEDKKSATFLNAQAAEILGASGSSSNDLVEFLEHSKSNPIRSSTKPILGLAENLEAFVQKVEGEWLPLQDVIFEWMRVIISTYRDKVWDDDLKPCFMRIISYVDNEIYHRIQADILRLQSQSEERNALTTYVEMVQTLFELHLDLVVKITNPNSIVAQEMKIISKDRLDRWADLASNLIHYRTLESTDELSLRYLWASVFYATMSDDVARDHQVLCWSDLKAILIEVGSPTIELQNNAVMSEISVDAAEREVAILTTMDFFYKLFDREHPDPIAVIETLEPVLDSEPTNSFGSGEEQSNESTSETRYVSPGSKDMWKLLGTGNTSLRLFMWQRLREAYARIGYNTKVFSCYLKSIETIVSDLRSSKYSETIEDARHHQLLLWLKALDDLLVKALTIALNDSASCFEIIDERHLKSTCTALAQLSRVLHTAATYDDEIRIGMTQFPRNPEYGLHGTFQTFNSKLREMQVRAWALQYTMIKEAIAQNLELFETPDKTLADYLALVHYCLGLRKCCKSSNKIFLKMMKVEMMRLKHVENWEDYLGQVLYDLYGLRLGVGTFLIEDHGCPTETLDRRTVFNIADQVIMLASRMPLKDLVKHELKGTIEKMQTAVGPAKETAQMNHNNRNISELLKTSIRPLHLWRAFKGEIYIDSVPVVAEQSALADKGWYFLLGMIALTRFRSQKRLGPGGQIDDMKVGESFMRLQLKYKVEHWETWYRLAQCYDYGLEDEVMWTADKINNHPADLVKIQRSAIHCYTMALSTSVRKADDSPETLERLSEMYHDFGMRIYASSREPFTMQAFYMDEFERHFSGQAGMYKRELHSELTRFKAWKYAATLFRRALENNSDNWINHYMLGKSLWKMFTKRFDEWELAEQYKNPSMYRKPTVQAILNAFVEAIKTVPKPRDGRQEPILEPHYKLVSTVHKLVMMGAMELQDAANLLQQQPYAINKGTPVTVSDGQEWDIFILDSLRYLRNADKQHWQHRMVARVARILFDESAADPVQAAAAAKEFRESIFTKTMHIQVWKPEVERPGRHCVYMEKYVLFMMRLLVILEDKANVEALCKRVRKKSNDFQHFENVWTECCNAYLRLIRRTGNILPSTDDIFRSVSPEEFAHYSKRIEDWINDPTQSHPALDALRESVDLKKTNANQIKTTAIDDLINDAWAVLYTNIGKTLPGPDLVPPQPAQIDSLSETRPTGPMSLDSLVMDVGGEQIPVPLTFAPSDVGRPRKIGVSRREVLRRAEAAVTRAPEPVRQLLPSQPQVKETPANLILGSNAAPPPSAANAARQTIEKQDPPVEASTPGSTHQSVDDDADDESDLSDPPDMDDEDHLFPNLVRRETNSTHGGANSSSAGGNGSAIGTPAIEE
ncbi:hypothetical protein B0O99DRAFT_744278 [Bisporella sp. PMI_857]|nr:hypothetical protein B0O99DRAFT_744278 [Bisporella sp. PMI_857]